MSDQGLGGARDPGEAQRWFEASLQLSGPQGCGYTVGTLIIRIGLWGFLIVIIVYNIYDIPQT